MRLKSLHESAGREVANLLRAYLEENGIEVSQFREWSINSSLGIQRGDRWARIMVHDSGRIDISLTRDRGPSYWKWGTPHLDKHRVFNFHDPDSFQKVEALIRDHLDVDAPGPRLPSLPIHESQRVADPYTVAELLAKFIRDARLPGYPTVEEPYKKYKFRNLVGHCATIIVRRLAPSTSGFDQIANIVVHEDGDLIWRVGLCISGCENPIIGVSQYRDNFHRPESFEKIVNTLRDWWMR